MAISREPNAARATAAVMAVLRPMRSPMMPKSRPPMGRAMKPTAKMPSVARNALEGFSLENSAWAM